MAEYKAKYVVPPGLIQRLQDERKITSAQQVITSNGLDWKTPFKMSDDVTIAGPNDAILRFVIEHMETMLEKRRNPTCQLFDRKAKFYFFDTLGEKIYESREKLKEKHSAVEIDNIPGKCVRLVCSFEGYSKIKQTVDKIRDSKPSSDSSSSSMDKSLLKDKSQQNGNLGSSNTLLPANNSSTFPYSFNANKIRVHVYKESIIAVTGIDAIVNAAGNDLRHYGGIALAIGKAAGFSVENECLNYVSQHGRVKVGKSCVTGPGRLKHLKGIIHAVGPYWDAYTDKTKCAMDLHETVVHVLQTAHEMNYQKIALPAISSGSFRVPLDTCAEMYIKAIMDYSRDAKPNCVTEVHFVDLNEDILRKIKESHEKWLRSPDGKNALKHAGGQRGAKPQPGANFSSSLRHGAGHPGLPHGGASYLPCEVHYIGKETMPFGGQQTIFKVKNSVKVRIYTGSIVKVSDADALVCSVGFDLRGGQLAAVFESTGGASYTTALNELKKKSPPLVGDVVVLLESGKLKSKYVLLAIMESRRITTMDKKTAQKLKDMYVNILETASAYSMKKIAFTLLGSGMLVKDAQNLECCCNSLFEGLTNSQVVRGISVEDIQVVNVHPEVTEAIVKVFHQHSSPGQARSDFEVGEVGGSNSSGGRMPKQKKSDVQICHTQSQRIPWKDEKAERKKERAKYTLMYNPSSSWISQDKNDNNSQGQDHEMLWKEEKEEDRARHSSLTSLDEKDADNFDQGPNEKFHQKETQRTLPETGDGVSWMETGTGAQAGNLNIFGVEAGQLKTIKHFKIEKSSETCNSDICDKTAQKTLSCGHKFCQICFIPMERNPVCTICSQKSHETTLGASSVNPGKEKKMQEAASSSDTCIICMDKLTKPYKLPCGHDSFHEKCINEAFVYKEVCPLCGKVLGTVTGSQPEGTMTKSVSTRSLPGYEECGLIEIFYEFRNGIQSENHPHPRMPYKGTRRKAYLPDNPEGNKVFKMLKVAFDRKLVFTIGESRTTGKTDTVTWNDIHHKTKIDGGPSNCGYPDPDYLRRVKEELDAKGVKWQIF